MAKNLVLFTVSSLFLGHSMAQISIENDYVGIVVDTAHGCSLSSIWATGDPAKTNLVNTYDLGRYIQASYYSGPQGYENCEWSGSSWSWNPIAAGDSYGNPSAVLSAETSDNGTTVVCTMIPMQWACDNIPCECTVDIVYQLDGAAISSSVVLNNNRSDTAEYGAYSQEAPAVYVNGFLDRLLGYAGSDPCGPSAGDVTEYDAGWDDSGGWPWVPGHMTLSEPWIAFAQANDFALGIYSGSIAESYSDGYFHFDAGFAGTKGSGGTSDSSTGYFAPIATVDLPSQGQWTYAYTLLVGDQKDIRNKACSLWNAQMTSKS